ncbi:MAG TPA: cell wall hydrolase [Hyphomonadaceae bacterium]|nr:cell wall hydrolase [Hyphomonadaceae bacterium]
MSGVEKRQTRQRAGLILACAAVFVAGGPLVASRFDIQKSEEAYRADAYRLARSISGDAPSAVKLVSFTNKADPKALRHSDAARVETVSFFQPISYTKDAAADLISTLSVRARDSLALRGLAAFTAENLGVATHEQSELDCLAEAVYYEARSESARGQMAVAEVVMNRVHDSRFPKTVCDVVFQGRYRDTGCQFTFTCDGSMNHKPDGEAWDRAKSVALHVALGLSKPVTNHATHYHTDYVNPYWKAGMVETAVIGTHIFYRFPKTGPEWATARLALAAQDQRDVPAPAEALTVNLKPEDAAPEAAEKPVAPQLVKISAEPPATAPAPVVTAVAAATPAPDARPL